MKPTRDDNGSVLVQSLEEVFFQWVVVQRAVDVGRSDGRVWQAIVGEKSLALVLPLVSRLRIHRIALSRGTETKRSHRMQH